MSKANSLKKSETFDNFLDRMRLSIRTPINQNKIFILVEGSFDVLFYKKFYKKDQYEIHEVAGGCLNVEKAIKVLFGESKQFIGIRDADFYHLEGLKPECEAVFLTDTHDAETMCLALDNVIAEILREGGLEEEINEFREYIFLSIKFISCAKWYNYKHSLGLNFSGIKPHIFIKNGVIKEEEFFDNLFSRSSFASDKNKLISGVRKTFKESSHDLFQLSNGHDLIGIICYRASHLSKLQIETILRTAYSEEDFKQTKLFQNIQDWLQNRNLFCDKYRF